MSNTNPKEEFIREEALKKCPDLYAHLLDLERYVEPFYGVLEQPFEEELIDDE